MRDLLFTRYLRNVGVAVAIALSVTAAAYVVTDPQGLLGTPPIAGVNEIKPYFEHNRELSRWRRAQRFCPTAAIVGNSRAEIGFDPDYDAFGTLGYSAFNHAIPGSGLDTSLNQLRWLAEAGCSPRLIVVGVDFPDFLVDPARPALARPPRTPAPRIELRTVAETVLSLKGLRDAAETIIAQYLPDAATTTARGLNPLSSYPAEIRRVGQHVFFRQRAEENYRVWRTRPKSVVDARGSEGPAFDSLRSIVDFQRASQGKVVIVIYPYHAQLRLMLDALGFADAFDDWKRRVVEIAARARRSNPNVAVWDFSGVSDVTTEAIPAPGDTVHTSRWYWEGGHFRRELGDRMLDQMLLGRPDLGVELDEYNVEAVLARDRQRMSELSRGSPLANDLLSLMARGDAANVGATERGKSVHTR